MPSTQSNLNRRRSLRRPSVVDPSSDPSAPPSSKSELKEPTLFVDENGRYPRTGRRGAPQVFPRKLYEILTQESNCTVAWTKSGTSFVISDMQDFTQNILMHYFRHTKYSSFQRQLNLYGFRKVAKGPDTGAYSHEAFLRDDPDMLEYVRRLPQGLGSNVGMLAPLPPISAAAATATTAAVSGHHKIVLKSYSSSSSSSSLKRSNVDSNSSHQSSSSSTFTSVAMARLSNCLTKQKHHHHHRSSNSSSPTDDSAPSSSGFEGDVEDEKVEDEDEDETEGGWGDINNEGSSDGEGFGLISPGDGFGQALSGSGGVIPRLDSDVLAQFMATSSPRSMFSISNNSSSSSGSGGGQEGASLLGGLPLAPLQRPSFRDEGSEDSGASSSEVEGQQHSPWATTTTAAAAAAATGYWQQEGFGQDSSLFDDNDDHDNNDKDPFDTDNHVLEEGEGNGTDDDNGGRLEQRIVRHQPLPDELIVAPESMLTLLQQEAGVMRSLSESVNKLALNKQQQQQQQGHFLEQAAEQHKLELLQVPVADASFAVHKAFSLMVVEGNDEQQQPSFSSSPEPLTTTGGDSLGVSDVAVAAPSAPILPLRVPVLGRSGQSSGPEPLDVFGLTTNRPEFFGRSSSSSKRGSSSSSSLFDLEPPSPPSPLLFKGPSVLTGAQRLTSENWHLTSLVSNPSSGTPNFDPAYLDTIFARQTAAPPQPVEMER